MPLVYKFIFKLFKRLYAHFGEAMKRRTHRCTSGAFGNFTYRLSLSVIVRNSHVAVAISARYALERCNTTIVIRTWLVTNYCQARLVSCRIFIRTKNIVYNKINDITKKNI